MDIYLRENEIYIGEKYRPVKYTGWELSDAELNSIVFVLEHPAAFHGMLRFYKYSIERGEWEEQQWQVVHDEVDDIWAAVGKEKTVVADDATTLIKRIYNEEI